MDLATSLLICLAALLAAFSALWAVSVRVRDASIVDPFWGPAFALVAWVSFGLSDSQSLPPLLLAVLVTIWAARLSAYLLWRNWGKGEDYRYRAMRSKHGERFPQVSLFTVFWLQACLAWVVSLPLQAAMNQPPNWSLRAWMGVAFWAAGLFFEGVGDYQLAKFKSDPHNRSKVMNRGLWKYTRHPNYFGDFLVWWGFYCIAANRTTWWWTIIGPVLMSVLLIRVSGVRLLESSLESRVEGYDQYIQNTSAFVPLPPKS